MTEDSIRSISKYEVLGVLGRGSMGVVYRARDPEIGRLVAIKTLRKVLPGSALTMDMALERFRIEARSAGQLRHPNIVTIFEVGRDKDTPFMVMDYVEGRGLDAILQEHKALEWRHAFKYLEQIASALDFAHKRGVIHRDIKPSNFLVDNQDRAYILDFGVAMFTETIKSERPSVVMGSPGYMSPEQILNQQLDARSDLFSFAILAFELLTGERPFAGQAMTEVVSNILNSPPKQAHQLKSELPASIDFEFARALSRNRDERFDTASSFCSALKHAFEIGNANHPSLRKTRGGTEWRRLLSWRMYKEMKGEQFGVAPTSPPALDEKEANRLKRKLKQLGFGKDESGESFAKAAHKMLKEQSAVSGWRVFTLVSAIIASALTVVLLWVLLSGLQRSLANQDGAVSQEPAVAKLSVNVGQPDTKLSVGGELLSELSDDEVANMLKEEANDEHSYVILINEATRRKLPVVHDVATRLLAHDSFIVRISVLKSIAQSADVRLSAAVIKELDDAEPKVRLEAVRTLLAINSNNIEQVKLIAPLSARLIREQNEQVRQEISNSIISLRSKLDLPDKLN